MSVSFIVFCISSAVIDGNWRLLEHSFSRMGISDNQTAAFLFNFGCVITGLLGIAAASGVVQYSNRRMKIAGALMMAEMLTTALIGIFTLDNRIAHYTIVCMMAAFFLMMVLVCIYDAILRERNKTSVICILAAVLPLVVFLVSKRLVVYQPFAILGAGIVFIVAVYNIRFEQTSENA